MLLRALGGVAVALASHSVLATTQYALTVDNAQEYARELNTGSQPVTIDYESTGKTPVVTLTGSITSVTGELTDIETNDTVHVTFSLQNAKFARNVQEANLYRLTTKVGTGAESTNSLRVIQKTDGEEGDSEVTFTVEARTNALEDIPQVLDTTVTPNVPTTAAVVTFSFRLPQLTGLNNRPVTAKATVAVPGGSGWEAHGTDTATSTIAESPSLVTFAQALVFIGSGDGGRTTIKIDDRESLGGNGLATLANVRLGLGQGTTGFTTAADIPLQSDGDPFSIDRRQDGAGTLGIWVTGDFRSGDQVFLDMNRDGSQQNDEALSLRNGVMSGNFPADEVGGDRAAAEDEEQLLNEGLDREAVLLRYKPNGDDAMRPAEFRTTMNLDMTEATSRDVFGGIHRFTTSYSTIESTQKAYAIPPVTDNPMSDNANVRIKCEAATECTVYLECDDQEGESWFTKLRNPIEGRSTMRITSEGVAEAIGEDDWNGRLSCIVYSTRAIAVQVLTRSAGGVLVNNTYIDQ